MVDAITAKNEASYVIWVSGGTYYAKNGSTGAVTSNASFSTLINTCIDAIDSGTIYLKAGTYTVGTKIDVTGTQEIIIRGAGKYATILDCKTTTGDTAIEVGDTTDISHEFKISDLQLQGTGGTTTLLYIMCTRFWQAENCLFLYFKYGLHLTSESDSSSLFGNLQSCDFIGDDIADNTAGLMIDGGGAFTCNDNNIIGCRFYFCKYGVQVDYGFNNVFLGCDFEECDYGVYLGPNYAQNTSFFNCNFEANTTRDLLCAGGAANNMYNHFLDCTFRTAGKEVTDTGWYNRYEYCLGYKTLNSASSTGTGAQQTIAHGLGATPDRVMLSNLGGGAAANAYQSAGADATNIYITAVLNMTYYWVASFHILGEAGSP